MEYPLTNWYVIQTISKKENNVKKKVEKIKIEDLITLLPMRKLCIKRKGKFIWELKPLFPGYFFVNKKFITSDIKKISRLDGVIKILKSNSDPVSVPEEDMKLIFSIIDDEAFINESQAFYKNERIFIKGGPLMNMEGYIIAVDKRRKRITVRLPFFNSHKEVQLSFELAEKINQKG